MVETLIYESPLQEEPETSPPPKFQETAFPYTPVEDEYVMFFMSMFYLFSLKRIGELFILSVNLGSRRYYEARLWFIYFSINLVFS